MINDGYYKFVCYFLFKQYYIFVILVELLENNDVEFFDLVNDFEENYNFVWELEKYWDLLMIMNDKFNQFIVVEIGEDDGSYMFLFEGSQWDMLVVQMY